MKAPRSIDYAERIYRAMDYVSRNIERDLSLEEIAATAAFSPFHFHRIFKAITGENVAEFTRRLRLELAANRLLAYPKDDITSIALSCGFSSSQNFTKAFKLRYSGTPSEYRRGRSRLDAENAPPAADVKTIGSADGSADRASAALLAAELREMPVSKAATIRRIGSYAESCPSAFAQLLAWASGRFILGPGTLMAFYWDNPEITPPERCRFDCCLTLPKGSAREKPAHESEIRIQEIGGGTWAFCRFETAPQGIKPAWESAFRWLVENGYECRPLPCAEIYLNDARFHPEGTWIIDIAIPLQTE